MEDIFYSGTFGGEALSLAASIATIKKINSLKVPKKLWGLGDNLMFRMNNILKEKNLYTKVHIEGSGWWPRITFKKNELEPKLFVSLFRQSMVREGLLIASSLNLSLPHNEKNIINETLVKFEKALDKLANDIQSKNPEKHLLGDLITPIFTVR